MGAGAIIGIRRSAAVAVIVIGRDGCARRGEAVLGGGGGKRVTRFNGGAQRREAAARNCNGHF